MLGICECDGSGVRVGVVAKRDRYAGGCRVGKGGVKAM